MSKMSALSISRSSKEIEVGPNPAGGFLDSEAAHERTDALAELEGQAKLLGGRDRGREVGRLSELSTRLAVTSYDTHVGSSTISIR
jgi:hypothetical protein